MPPQKNSTVITYGGDGVFAKIKSMILEDIAALEQQAKDDATEKGYCDGEPAKTEAKKVELDDDIEALMAKIDWAISQSAQAKAAIAEARFHLKLHAYRPIFLSFEIVQSDVHCLH